MSAVVVEYDGPDAVDVSSGMSQTLKSMLPMMFSIWAEWRSCGGGSMVAESNAFQIKVDGREIQLKPADHRHSANGRCGGGRGAQRQESGGRDGCIPRDHRRVARGL